MKEILMFHRDDCGYCDMAKRALTVLYSENPTYRELELTQIEETRLPEVADRYDYYAVPTIYVDRTKVFEAHIGMRYDDIKAEIKRALDLAMA